MNIEVQQPELEAIILRRMASGRFKSVEDVLLQALESAPWPQEQRQEKPQRNGAELVEACARVSGLLTDQEIDTLFSRTSSVSRPVDFE